MRLSFRIALSSIILGSICPIPLHAQEIDLTEVSGYLNPGSEFKESSELSDIHPDDWTYKALSKIRQDRRCNLLLPQGVITRFEAAAFLDKCIGNAVELTDTEFDLVDEFTTELASIHR